MKIVVGYDDSQQGPGLWLSFLTDHNQTHHFAIAKPEVVAAHGERTRELTLLRVN